LEVSPENLVPEGLIKRDSSKYWILNKIYNYSYRKANRIIVLGDDMRELLLLKVKPKIKIIDVIPNWSDNDIHPLTNFDIPNYLGINVEDKIIIGFAGNLGRVQGLLEFIDLFISSGNNKIVLVIIGDGALKTELVLKIKNENLQNVYYLGPKGRNEQNLFLNACNIGLVTLANGMKGLGVPSKTYNLMAAGKPLLYIGDRHSEIDIYVNKFDCGWSFSWENKIQILYFLSNLSLESLSEIQNKGLNSLNYSNNFKKEVILNLY